MGRNHLVLMVSVRALVPLGILAGPWIFVPTLVPILSLPARDRDGFVDSPKGFGVAEPTWESIHRGHLLIPILMREGLDDTGLTRDGRR